MTYVLEMKNIKKSFNGVSVLKGVSLSVKPGEIHALLGENGAGKSTLMNTLGGVIQPDEGEIVLFGRKQKMTSPAVSKSLGVGFVHQELNLIPDLTVYENLFLGTERKKKNGFLDTKTMIHETQTLLDDLQVNLKPTTLVSHLDASYKQIIEISKTLLHKSRIIIMDEPTTSLTEHEINNLFRVMRQLKEQGFSIIFISHKLKEVLTICDRYTILRDGELASTGDVSTVTEEDLARMMVGKAMENQVFYEARELGETWVEVRNYSADNLFDNINFSLKKGEIVGLTGLSGDGRSELVETIFGYRKKTKGDLFLHEKPVSISHPKQALTHGIGLVPKNRKENSIIPDMNVLENFTLPAIKQVTKHHLIQQKKEQELYNLYQQQLNIKAADTSISIAQLSGGNQQKVILAKWIEAKCDLIMLDNPTQGVDIGAKNDIYSLISTLAKQGKSFLILSNEYQELYRLCDRVLVMYQGNIQAELSRQELSEETIMMYATGAKQEGGKNHE